MTVRETVERCLLENGIEVKSNGDFEEIDSVNFISFVVALEDNFDIEFPDEYLLSSNTKSINSICNIIEELLIYNE